MRGLLPVVASVALFAAAPQDPQTVFRGGAQTVAVYATVRDEAGRLVPGLTRDDFQVLDDGRPAVITTFSNDVLPANIALLLDMSISMLGEHVRVRDAALHFVDALLPADRVRVGTFGEEISLSPWLTSDRAILERVIREEVWPGGNTPLWSAMHAAMSSLSDETDRRVIVTLTDGIDTGCVTLGAASSGAESAVVRLPSAASSGTDSPVVQRPGAASSGTDSRVVRANPACPSFADAQKLAFGSEFMVYAIGMEGPGITGGLVKLADDTGGGRFELKRNQDLAATFAAVAEELHHQYALGFTPVALDGRLHAVDVRLARRGLTARARKSYLATER